MQALADRAVQALEVAKILEDPEHALYLPAAKWAAEHGYGKPKESVEHTGAIGLRITFTQETRDDGITE